VRFAGEILTVVQLQGIESLPAALNLARKLTQVYDALPLRGRNRLLDRRDGFPRLAKLKTIRCKPSYEST
jgi:hypothetical protein